MCFQLFLWIFFYDFFFLFQRDENENFARVPSRVYFDPLRMLKVKEGKVLIIATESRQCLSLCVHHKFVRASFVMLCRARSRKKGETNANVSVQDAARQCNLHMKNYFQPGV